MAFLENAEVLAAWRSLGGLETLHSYGVDVGLAMAGRDFGAGSSGIRGPISRTPSALSRKTRYFNVYWRLLFLPCWSKAGRAPRSPGPR